MDGLLVSYIIPLLMGFGFVALGFYIIYGRHTLVISHSIEHAAAISQAFTAFFAVWHFAALSPAVSMVHSVRSEEWWRRLLKGTPFSRANSVSSNNRSASAHMAEIVMFWSSPYFRVGLIAALIAAVLGDIAPAAIDVEVGLDAVSASFPVPALPPDSIYSNYSQPFLATGDQVHASIDIAPIYFNAMAFGVTYVKAAPPMPNALVPRPNIAPGQGYRYLTDVVFMNYNCNWSRTRTASPK
ncbi:hypothetical protein PILCRDRAFT_574042 [Piloderma croceum F 1598]|uniref:Uncharacterized protein n=1 Tax=Piloderma croceum (strain F 1598) TaxID=765440 RepID=A0A0C3AYE0_PILCF|nr:hypothetical protein PILCRDRAFT_574042 [Piloderma croceum F 1598]